MMITPRRALGIGALVLALSGCGAADAGPAPAVPPSPPPPAASTAAPTVTAAAQAFAANESALTFHDPDRRKKLAKAFAKIDEIGEDELKVQGLPSLSLGVVIDGELAYAKGFGVADGGAKPDADTVYRIGSITKSFTATALLALRDDGALSLDDPLSRWIPEAAKLVYPTHDSPPITLRQLLTHTSGLPRLGKLPGARTDRANTEEELVQSLAGLPLENPPGTKHVYSNLGFALLGIVVGRAAHAPFREVMKKRVLAPLAMTSSVWDRGDVPAGHLAAAYAKGPLGAPVATPHWLLGAEEGAGGLYSSVRDMARYLAFQLAAYPPRNAADDGPIRRSSVREGHFNALWDALHIRLNQTPQKGESLLDAGAYRYGYGWVAQQTCELDQLVWHNGGIDGYRTDVAFLPEHGVGVIALINLAGASPEAVVQRMLTELRRTGGLSKRSPAIAPAFEPVMQKLLAVYNGWDEPTYHAMLTSGRPVTTSEEKDELEGYKKLHGTCKSYVPLVVRGRRSAVFKMDCERGTFEMDVALAADDLITGFSGTSRDLPVPPELRGAADRVVGLIKKWDDAVFRKHLAKTKRPHDETAKLFDDLRNAHGACTAKSLTSTFRSRKIALECERGGPLALSLSVDPKSADTVTAYAFESVGQGTCPVR
ncbi:Beta-lactamase class C and other penicillin binding protein [Minicystis rosea]|nr:Beta-lactamase class C and other penicillin binding protein [Minicystis rosea]